jgi:Domain of unknown function (DUF5615)
MNLYLDDDTTARRLVALLSNANHAVVVPADVELTGMPDARHFIYVLQQSLVLVTRNHDDLRHCSRATESWRAPACLMSGLSGLGTVFSSRFSVHIQGNPPL